MKRACCPAVVVSLVALATNFGVQAQEKEPPKHFTNSIGMKFVWIPPGTFLMGSPEDEKGRARDETQHKVTLTKGFYLGVYEVTQKHWQAIMGNNPSDHKGEKNLPVERVSWDDCQEFLKKLGKKEGLPYRLPTEAEWEYACRAGSKGAYCYGNDQDLCSQYAWAWTSENPASHPVGQKKSNLWGLCDIHGNVWEWCQDWYGEYPQENVADPKGPQSGIFRVLRGGSFGNAVSHVRCAQRGNAEPSFHSRVMGFRVTLSPQR